jgi:UV DNA damage endonuclease
MNFHLLQKNIPSLRPEYRGKRFVIIYDQENQENQADDVLNNQEDQENQTEDVLNKQENQTEDVLNKQEDQEDQEDQENQENQTEDVLNKQEDQEDQENQADDVLKGEKKYSDKQVSDNKNRIDLGLCCINTVLRKQKPSVFPNRTCRLNTALTKGIEYVQKLALENITDVLKILKWNYENGIYSYRLSSDMFPHINNPKFGSDRFNRKGEKLGTRYSLSFAKSILKQIGIKAKEYGIRLSFHPGQYNQIASPTESVFDNTVRDLSAHARILDIIEDKIDFGKNKAIICIHGGGVYNDKEKTIKRWIDRFKTLPQNVKDRLCLENCEKCYSTSDCLKICDELNIPLIYDIHHYNCYSLLHPDEKQEKAEKLMPLVLETWNRRNMKPYFHISEQGSGRIGHHSDYIETIPEYIFNLNTDITLDVEAKAKEQAIIRLKDKYNL